MPYKTHFLLCLATLLFVVTTPVRAETFHVSTTGADVADRDGKSAATAWKSLAYACERTPAGDHTIALATGTFVASETARPKQGITIAGQGQRGKEATRIVASQQWKLVAAETLLKPPEEFLIAIVKGQDITIRDLELASDPAHRISGALYCAGAARVTLRAAALREFRWAAIYAEHSHELEIAHCQLENGSTEKDKHHSGSIRTKWIKHSQIHHNRIVNTVGKEYGYKGGGHEAVRFHHNHVEVGGEFAFESAHENEFGLELDHNYLNRCISVPKSGQGSDPNSREFEFTVWIHHNLLTDSYTVEGPRNHLRFSHNYVRIEKPGGRVYSQHGGDNDGPVWIHHNVVENLDRAFVWKNRGRAEQVFVYNNTVFCADAEDRAAAIIDAFHEAKQPIAKWEVKNNIFVAPASQPRKLFADQRGADKHLGLSHNMCVNVTGLPEGNIAAVAAGLNSQGEKPWPYFAPPANARAIVGQGVDVGLPFRGTRPTIGAFEPGGENPWQDLPTGE